MRKQTTVKLQDGENVVTFRITQLSAIGLEIFLAKVARLFAKSGLFDADFGKTKDLESIKDAPDIAASIADILLKNGPQALSNFDVDEGVALMDELMSKCVERLDGNFARALDRSEIESCIETLPALIQLQKEVIKFNLNFLQNVAKSTTPTSPNPTTKQSEQKISLRSYKS